MKRNTVFALLALAAAVATVPACSQKGPFACISPLPAGYSLENLDDCTVPASFGADDFNWRGSNLTMTVFSEDLYDAVEVSRMVPGDTLVFAGSRIVVESVEESDGFLTVNGGIEEGGAYLKPYEGGTYRSLLMDDHPFYSRLGEKEVLLDDDFVIIDCGTEPSDPSDTVRTAQKPYIESLGHRSDFSELDTRVRLEGGRVVEIQRFWIP